MFFYKLNLVQKNFIWYGSRACKKKDLRSPQWLRNIKSRKYPLWKINILFSKIKHNNVNFIKNGGWHFSNIKLAKDIDYKMKNYLHHLEYEESGLKIEDVEKIISEKRVIYDLGADKRVKKWNSSTNLITEDEKFLPEYIKVNKKKFLSWLE